MRGSTVGSSPAGVALALGESRARSDGFGRLRDTSPPQGQGRLWQGALPSIVSPCVLDVELEHVPVCEQAGVL